MSGARAACEMWCVSTPALVKGRQVSDLPVDLSRFRQIRWFYRAIRGKCGAGTHADDRNDGRDGAGHAIIDRFLVVSVLPASMRGILRRGASGFYTTTLGTVLVNPERFGWNFPGFS